MCGEWSLTNENWIQITVTHFERHFWPYVHIVGCLTQSRARNMLQVWSDVFLLLVFVYSSMHSVGHKVTIPCIHTLHHKNGLTQSNLAINELLSLYYIVAKCCNVQERIRHLAKSSDCAPNQVVGHKLVQSTHVLSHVQRSLPAFASIQSSAATGFLQLKPR